MAPTRELAMQVSTELSSVAPSLETLCVRWNVREDVAGASFMALGSAAPEVIINAISTLKTVLSTEKHDGYVDEGDDGADAVTPSGEAANGQSPAESIATMNAIVQASEAVLTRKALADSESNRVRSPGRTKSSSRWSSARRRGGPRSTLD